MSDHFSPIGFSFETEEDLRALIASIWDDSEVVECRKGSYVRWASEEGPEIWLQFDKKRRLIGGTPFFRGKSSQTMGLTQLVRRDFDTLLEGAVQGWINPNAEITDGDYPLLFDVVDIGMYPQLDLPFASPVKLAAFAHELAVYASDEAFLASQAGDPKFAPESFIPVGLFAAGKPEHAPPSLASFSGHVVESEHRLNPVTNSPYFWMLVKTLGCEIDVVCNLKQIQQLPRAGSVVSGTFWLCGQILEPSETEPPGLLNRLFGKNG